MNGGGGYLPEQIGMMSLDQIWFRLCDTEILKKKSGSRTSKMKSLSAAGSLKADDKGFFRGRAEDGTAIRGRIGGKSLARQLMEKEAERKAKERLLEKKRKRRKKRK